MYNAKQYYMDGPLKVQKSTNGAMIKRDAVITGSGGPITLYFGNAGPTSGKRFCSDFFISLTIEVSTSNPPTANKVMYAVKDIQTCMRSKLELNGSVNITNDHTALVPIYKCYTDTYRSVDDLGKHDLYVYEPDGTGFENNTNTRGVKTKNAAGFFDMYYSAPLLNEALIAGFNGCTSMDLTIEVANNLFGLFATDIDQPYTVKITKATLSYWTHDVATDSCQIYCPHFLTFPKTVSGGSFSIDTKSVNGIPKYIFTHISQNPFMFSSKTTATDQLLTKPVPFKTLDMDINNNLNALNATDKELYGLSLMGGYKSHSIQDYYNADNILTEFGGCVKIDLNHLPLSISSSDILRVNALCTYSSSKSNLFNYTSYCYISLLKLSASGGENTQQIISYDIPNEVEEYDEIEFEDLIHGSGFFGKIKDFFKSGKAGKLLDKGIKVLDVVAPNATGVKQGLEKAQAVNSILSGNSTALF